MNHVVTLNFIALLSKIWGPSLLALVAAAPFDAGGKQIDVTVSIGLNLAHSEQGTVDDAVKRADEALYRAKSMGRNRVEVAE